MERVPWRRTCTASPIRNGSVTRKIHAKRSLNVPCTDRTEGQKPCCNIDSFIILQNRYREATGRVYNMRLQTLRRNDTFLLRIDDSDSEPGRAGQRTLSP
jgi:hypothetical protein